MTSNGAGGSEASSVTPTSTIVICGAHTHAAKGVAAELTIIQEERKPYFLLRGRHDRPCTKPKNARASDEMHAWRWKSLHDLIYARG